MPGDSSIFTPTFWFPILGGHVEPTILVRGHVFSRSQTPFLGVAVLSPFDLRLGENAICYCTGQGCPANCQSTTPCYLDNDGETLRILGILGNAIFSKWATCFEARNRVSWAERCFQGENVRSWGFRSRKKLVFCWRLLFAFSKRNNYLKRFTNKNPVMLILISTLSFFLHIFWGSWFWKNHPLPWTLGHMSFVTIFSLLGVISLKRDAQWKKAPKGCFQGIF